MNEPLDIALRHQAFIEGVKNYEQSGFDETALALVGLLSLLLNKSGYQKLSDMPKRKLNEFTADFNKRATPLMVKFRKGFSKELQRIAKIDALITAMNLAFLTDKPAISPATAATWAGITNEVMPSSGHLPLQLLKDFARSASSQIGLLIKRAYAEKWSAGQLAQAMNGTRARNYKDGLLHKLKTQFNTVQQTLIQHIHQWIKYNFSKAFYTHYQWVSVLDTQTTDICRGRNGKVYAYGAGPRPPAHYNCRSTIVGINGVMAYPSYPGFFSWISAQPSAIQNELLGKAQAQKLRAGKLGEKQLPKFDATKKIAPNDLTKYQRLITGEK